MDGQFRMLSKVMNDEFPRAKCKKTALCCILEEILLGKFLKAEKSVNFKNFYIILAELIVAFGIVGSDVFLSKTCFKMVLQSIFNINWWYHYSWNLFFILFFIILSIMDGEDEINTLIESKFDLKIFILCWQNWSLYLVSLEVMFFCLQHASNNFLVAKMTYKQCEFENI